MKDDSMMFQLQINRWLAMLAVMIVISGFDSLGAQESFNDEASKALRRGVQFFTTQVAGDHGGYLFGYSSDLAIRQGEVAADDQTAWLEPPGTGFVGEAYLFAYAKTGDVFYLNAARKTAGCLINGQLQSGGWV